MSNTSLDKVSAEASTSELAVLKIQNAQLLVANDEQARAFEEKLRAMDALQKKFLILHGKVDATEDSNGMKDVNGEEKVFHLFSRLPAELRRMVWESYLSSRRVVDVGFTPKRIIKFPGQLESLPALNPLNQNQGQNQIFSRIFEKSPGIQILLSTCKESRKTILQALTAYETFSMSTGPGFLNTFFARDALEGDAPLSQAVLSNRGIPFRPDVDVIYIGPNDNYGSSTGFGRYIMSEDLMSIGKLIRIVKLALDIDWVLPFLNKIRTKNRRNAKIPSLKELIVVERSTYFYTDFRGETFSVREDFKDHLEEVLGEDWEMEPTELPLISFMHQDELRALM